LPLSRPPRPPGSRRYGAPAQRPTAAAARPRSAPPREGLKRTVHPPSWPVPGARPPYRDSCSVLPRRLKVAA